MPAQAKVKNRTSSRVLVERTALILILAALLVFYVLLPQLRYFRGSVATIQDAYFPLVGLAVILVSATFFCAAGTFWLLANFKLNYWRTLLIQIADGFTGRLLPAGAGGVATNLVYLSRRHGRVRAGMIVGLNNTIGFIGHIVLLLVLLLINSFSSGGHVAVRIPGSYYVAAALVLAAAVAVFVLRRRFSRFSPKSTRSVAELISFIVHHPARLLAAFGTSMLLTTLYSMALYAVMLSLNVHMSYLQAFIVLTAGVLVMTATPTPGGIGGAEAGIVASMVSFGVAGEQALSVALVYRLISYWLPLLPGLISLRIALKKRYLIV